LALIIGGSHPEDHIRAHVLRGGPHYQVLQVGRLHEAIGQPLRVLRDVECPHAPVHITLVLCKVMTCRNAIALCQSSLTLTHNQFCTPEIPGWISDAVNENWMGPP
jgi:hypothetical protein